MKPYQARIALMQAGLSPAALKVAIRILDAQGLKGGVCTLSVARLAEDCGMAPATAKHALSELAKRGALESEARPGQRARRVLDVARLGAEGVSRRTPVSDSEPVSKPEPGGVETDTGGVSKPEPGGVETDTSYREGSERDLEKDLRRAERAPKTTPDRSPLEAARSALTTGYARRYERDAGDAWMAVAANHTAIGSVAAWVAAKPEELAARAEAVLDGAFADEWMSANRWPWRAIAKDPARYAAGPNPMRRGALPPATIDPEASRRSIAAARELFGDLPSEAGHG